MNTVNSQTRTQKNKQSMWPLMKAMTTAGLASAILGGCTFMDVNNLNAANEPELQIRALPLITRGDKTPDGYYALGKYYLYQGRLEQAQEAFWDAVRMDPGHVDALNGLGVVYDKLGQYDAARKVYEAALLKDPGASHVWANLGYSLKLAGKGSESIAPLQQAIAIDPANAIAQQNLAIAEADVASRPAFNQSSSQEKIHMAVQANKNDESASEKPATNELAAKKSAEPIVSSSLQAVSTLASTTATKEAPKPIVQTSADRQVEQVAILADQPREKAVIKSEPFIASVINQFSSKREVIQHKVSASQSSYKESSVLPAKDSVAKPQMSSEAKLVPVEGLLDNKVSMVLNGLRIEVSNGNGVNGLAKAVGSEMSLNGLNVKRITNAKPFNKPQTLIMCRPELKSAAMELAQTMPSNPKIVLRDVANRRVDVRVVLGADTAIAWKDGSKGPYLVASLAK